MTPDRLDPLDPMFEEEPQAIRALHREIKTILTLLVESNAELKKEAEKNREEMRDGFKAVAAQCKERLTACNIRQAVSDKEVARLAIGQEVNKTKVGVVLGGTALGGGIMTKALDWLLK